MIALANDNVASGARDNSSSVTLTVTFTHATSAGNLAIIDCLQTGTFTLSSISDSRGNTWAVDRTETGNGPTQNIASCQITVGHQIGDTLTLTFGGASIYSCAVVSEWSGIVTSSATDQVTSTNSGVSTNPGSGATANTTVPQELLYAGVSYNDPGTYTAGSGFTLLTGGNSGAGNRKVQPEYQIVTVTGGYNGTFTGLLGGWGCAIATYKGVAITIASDTPVFRVGRGSAW